VEVHLHPHSSEWFAAYLNTGTTLPLTFIYFIQIIFSVKSSWIREAYYKWRRHSRPSHADSPQIALFVNHTKQYKTNMFARHETALNIRTGKLVRYETI
jgi:hypothetical protein